MTVNLVTGSVPRGSDYFGREHLIDQIWQRLATDNVLLLAPRRFGKTGAMFRLLDAPRDPFRPLYMDVEHLESPADFVIELLAALRHDDHFARTVNALWEETKEVGRYLRGLTSRIDLGSLKVYLREQTDLAKNWRSYGDRAVRLLAREHPRLLLLVDEFPIMVHQIAQRDTGELTRFLRWFRAARIAPDTQTRFLIGGSTNLVSALDAIGLVDTVNDFVVQQVEPFDSSTAERFVREALEAQGVQLSRDVRERMVSVVGTAIPYLLSLLLALLLDRYRKWGAPITVDTVQEVFETELLGGATPFFCHYYSRLQQYYPGDEARQAKAILGVLSRSDSPVRKDTLYQLYLKCAALEHTASNTEQFQRLMQKLENDFYVAGIDDAYRFSNRAIQLWWKNNYGFQNA